jgi:hypothetical protein
VLVAGSLALAGVLLYLHDYIVGSLIGGLALVRVVYLVGTSRRTGRFSSRPSGTGPVRSVLRELARHEFLVAARQIGLDPKQMRRAFDEGRSIAELAAGAGVPLERVVTAMVADATRSIDGKVATGQMTAQQAERVKARLPLWAGRLATFHKGDLRRLRAGGVTAQ